ncbi:MAG: cell division protein FtsL [Bacilli bacterium]|nr:cell division protein FtsL [Bacilli bacterium]
MKKRKMKKVVKIGKLEKLVYTFAIILLIALPFTVVFLQASLSKINIQVEQVKKEIKTQEKKNESLAMKINELASLDKIIEVAHEQGLSYNNDNIKSVE